MLTQLWNTQEPPKQKSKELIIREDDFEGVYMLFICDRICEN